MPLAAEVVVWAEITNPDQSTFDLQLNRISAPTYSASFHTSQPGLYTCRVRAEGSTSSGTPFTREQTVTAGVYYGNYDPVPQPNLGEEICKLIRCLVSEETLTPAAARRLAEWGINVKQWRECLAKCCPEGAVERIPGLNYKAFLAARKKLSQAKPAIALRRAGAPKRLPPPVMPVRKVEMKKEMDNNFPPLTEVKSHEVPPAARKLEMASHFPPLGRAKNQRRKSTTASKRRRP